ncbi:DUF452 family protein [Pasteurella testudinis]|uniref:DUF452 family protein n=1 Tax=Pasteurella testudinis TaxID=761 RepID=UPI004058094F
MKTELIAGAGNCRLILYFAGWGTSPDLVRRWDIPDDYDLLLCWDYRTLQFEFDLSRYQQLHLVAWSMGVWAAEQCLPANISLQSSVAINGTPGLIDDQFGIPSAVFSGTLHNFDDSTRAKFDRRMCGSREVLRQYQAGTLRANDEIKAELSAVYQALATAKAPHIRWQKAIVGSQDRIFPSANQLAYWQRQGCRIEQIDAPHFCFAHFDNWIDICR